MDKEILRQFLHDKKILRQFLQDNLDREVFAGITETEIESLVKGGFTSAVWLSSATLDSLKMLEPPIRPAVMAKLVATFAAGAATGLGPGRATAIGVAAAAPGSAAAAPASTVAAPESAAAALGSAAAALGSAAAALGSATAALGSVAAAPGSAAAAPGSAVAAPGSAVAAPGSAVAAPGSAAAAPGSAAAADAATRDQYDFVKTPLLVKIIAKHYDWQKFEEKKRS